MKQIICKTSEAPPQGEPQVWRKGDLTHAAANACLHPGKPLECKDGTFVGPWHGARFDMTDGCHLDGPAPTNARLMILPTRIEGDDLVYIWGEQ